MDISTYSHYANGRVQLLLTMKENIETELEMAFPGSFMRHEHIENAESLSWLWVLGAYEVTRTMHQAKKSFTPDATEKLQILKDKIAEIRIPASKMEIKNKKDTAMNSNRSPIQILHETQDIAYETGSTPIPIRPVLKLFQTTMNDIQSGIIARHEINFSKAG